MHVPLRTGSGSVLGTVAPTKLQPCAWCGAPGSNYEGEDNLPHFHVLPNPALVVEAGEGVCLRTNRSWQVLMYGDGVDIELSDQYS